MLIYVIRHGETEANAEGVFQGQSDCPLTAAGLELARETGRALRGTAFDAAYSSPLSRAFCTAQAVLEESGNDLDVVTDERLLEICMGEYEGKRFRPGEREVDAAFCKMFFEDPFSIGRFPRGENALDVCERTQAFLHELAAKDFNRVLVSTHGFALRAMLNRLYDNPRDFWQGHVPYNCSVSIVEADAGECRLVESDKVFYDEKLCVDRYAVY